MQEDIFDKIINFLLGASWAILAFGVLILFKTFLPFGIALTIFTITIFIVISLFMILALDAFSIHREKLTEIKKQTKLLQEIKDRYNI